MPFALYETDIDVGDTVRLKEGNPNCENFGSELGEVESVLLNSSGYWEVTVLYVEGAIVIESRQLVRLMARHPELDMLSRRRCFSA